MLKNYCLLSLIAFVSGFCLSLLIQPGIDRALITGLLTLPATLTGFLLTERQRVRQAGMRLTNTYHRVRALSRKAAQLHQAIETMTVEKQQLTTRLHGLQNQLKHLQDQVFQRSEQLEDLVWNLNTLQSQKRQLEGTITTLQSDLQVLKRRQGESQDSGPSPHPLQPAITQLQAQVNSLRGELEHLEAQILQQRHQKEQLDRELSGLRSQQLQIEETSRSIPVKSGSTVSKPLSTRLKLPITSTIPVRAKVVSPSPDPLPLEWREFVQKLPNHEFEVLQAIVAQINPNGVLKRVAEAHLTMPEVIIDTINERAIETIGDVIVEPGLGSTPPTIIAEYIEQTRGAIGSYEPLARP
ncbi:MAG: tellurite resistance TerB C-terminal domain-containing protein [Leptolyngbyaceae cyanobacterium bins.59]|nr:tellurite resistance TerB C-terminal domain-containing protein [Leptolyngbyaceae cyanobacterium bins.59]